MENEREPVPRVMAALRNLAIGALRLTGRADISRRNTNSVLRLGPAPVEQPVRHSLKDILDLHWPARCVVLLTPKAILWNSQFLTGQRHSKKETIRQLTGLLGIGSNRGFRTIAGPAENRLGRDWGSSFATIAPRVIRGRTR
ncbi:hypothetical protein AB0C38_15915 [Amycolatopsis sp. NPDC048633]|uniref:hypothetical protein n=1 Tax=Amycolatopsis sp. NPDC048633 TaxID=3157095 RepID=UPI0033DABC2B